MLRHVTIRTALRPWNYPIEVRTFAAKRHGSGADEAELDAARKWLARLDSDTIPRNLCEISFSRSSGPGGQNVNKCVRCRIAVENQG